MEFCSKRIGVALLLSCCLGMAGLAVGQTPTGSITGTVIDQQGLPVEGADLTLTNTGTNYQYKGKTSSSGAYQFQAIDYGLYSVSVAKQGFRRGVVENIKLDAATAFTVAPIKLELGVAAESVVVEAGAESVNTTSTEVSSTVEKKQIDELPILDRNPLNLLSLEAGFNQDVSGQTNGGLDTIAGQRTSFTNMTLDGINIQDNFIRANAVDFTPNYPFSSQAQEFTVIDQNADVDQAGGSSQVAIVTPKGTNTIHGEGFWYYRANSFAANDWFNDASGIHIPKLLQNQGGGNIGGPIIKNKLFVYGWYELLRLKQQSPNDTTILSPTILSALSSSNPTLPFTYQPVDANGNPSGSSQTVDLLTVLNQARGNPVFSAGSYVSGAPVFTVDSTMATLLKRMPTTSNNTRVGDGTNLLGYQFNERSDNTLDNTGARVDYDINAHNTITATFAWNRQIVDRPDIDTSFDLVPLVQNNNSEKFFSTAWRWNPNGSVTNEVRFGFNLAPAFFSSSQDFSSGYLIGIAGSVFTNPNANFLPQGRNTRTWQGSDNLSWVKGNHVLKFGAQVERVTIFATNSAGIYPTDNLGFSNINPFTPQVDDFPVGVSGAQIGTADLTNATNILASVAGIINQVTQTDNVTSQTSGYVPGAAQNRNYRQNVFGVYAGDVWRIKPRLTLSYGVRWDFYTPVDEKNGLVLLPVVPPGQTVDQALLGNATIDFAGGNSYRGLYNDYWKDFGPHIGIAWDPFGDGRTAIRAGFSINYVNDEFFSAADNAAVGNTGLGVNAAGPLLGPAASNQAVGYSGPTVANPQGSNTLPPPPFAIPSNFLTNAINATNEQGYIGSLAGYGIDPNMKPPYVEQWNLSIQHDIGWNTSLTVSYVGNHGVGLLRAIDLNQLNLNAGGFLADFNRARVNGFASLAANGVFDPTYQGTSAKPCSVCQPLTVFPLLPGVQYGAGPGFILYGPFTNLIYQGQAGALAGDYQADEFFSGFGVPGPTTNILNVFPNPYIMGADLLKNTSFSSYDAGIVEVRRRFSRGLYFQANYTYSKVMTDFGGSSSNFQPFQDNARAYLEKARAPFDLTHVFKGNFTYELPIGKGHGLLSSNNKVLGLLVDGWRTGSIFTWQSGLPFSIVSQYATFNRTGYRSNNNTAVATLTHNQISNDLGTFVQPNGIVYLINPKLINPANGTGAPSSPGLTCVPAVTGGFCNPQPGEVGNLQLNAFNEPAYFDWDISAGKDFNLTEKVKLNFTTSAFNVLNHPVFAAGLDSFGNYNMNINSTTFGQSTATASTPRRLQFQLLLKF